MTKTASWKLFLVGRGLAEHLVPAVESLNAALYYEFMTKLSLYSRPMKNNNQKLKNDNYS